MALLRPGKAAARSAGQILEVKRPQTAPLVEAERRRLPRDATPLGTGDTAGPPAVPWAIPLTPWTEAARARTC
eukprot:3780098-Pyramimonas_sp.AAC.1